MYVCVSYSGRVSYRPAPVAPLSPQSNLYAPIAFTNNAKAHQPTMRTLTVP